jgi:glycosyltransferase involved in cell wall biosynthesis
LEHRNALTKETPQAGVLDDAPPIRVLALLDDTVVSGIVKPVLSLARYARENPRPRRALEISMLTFVRGESDPEFVEALRREGFSIDVVRERWRFDLAVFAQLRGIIARRRPDVLWTQGAKTHFLVRLAGLHRKKAWVASHHGYTATSLAWRLYHQLDRWSLLGADSVIAACQAFAADLNLRLGIKKERLSVHRSPIAEGASSVADGANSAVRAELGLPADARIVLSVGRLSKEKGHADLIRAMVHVRTACVSLPVVLVIVGEGPERAQLEHLSRQLAIGNEVRLVGYRENVSPYYEAADVFALPSYSEGSPNVLLEAMDAGVPIVATAVGGVGEMIRHGEQGLLVPSGDAEELARALITLLSSPGMRAELSSAARRSLANYTPALYYAGVRSLFERVLDDRDMVGKSGAD